MRFRGNSEEGRLVPHLLSRSFRSLAGVCALVLCSASAALAQDYRLERLLTGVQQPTYAAHAPGDDNNLYWMERTKVVSGNPTATMGRMVKYDLTTKTATTFVDFAGIGSTVPNDSGSLCFAFHPDFATNGKFYTTYAASPQPVTNVLREYKVVSGHARAPAHHPPVQQQLGLLPHHRLDRIQEQRCRR
jgi:hypothetical protein